MNHYDHLTIETNKHLHIRDHIKHKGGTKTVCVSTCLSFLGIHPDEYNYTSSKTNNFLFIDIIRRKGFSVRSKMSELKLKSWDTNTTDARRALKKSKYGSDDYFLFVGQRRTYAHAIIMDGNGKTIIDTSPSSRMKTWKIWKIEKK